MRSFRSRFPRIDWNAFLRKEWNCFLRRFLGSITRKENQKSQYIGKSLGSLRFWLIPYIRSAWGEATNDPIYESSYRVCRSRWSVAWSKRSRWLWTNRMEGAGKGNPTDDHIYERKGTCGNPLDSWGCHLGTGIHVCLYMYRHALIVACNVLCIVVTKYLIVRGIVPRNCVKSKSEK